MGAGWRRTALPGAAGGLLALAALAGTVGATPAGTVGAVGTTLAGSAARSVMPPFTWSAGPVSAAQLGRTWHAGCPVGPASLRLLHLSYVGFDVRAHSGTMVVNARVVHDVVAAFARLYAARFPLRSLVPEAAFGGRDPSSMAADNTSSFNCRLAVAPGPPQWSVHAYGEAIDVNPVQNPYVEGGRVQPTAGRAYLDRHDVRPGMAVPGGTLVEAFAAVGWYWGGRWTATPDYQHFSLTGG